MISPYTVDVEVVQFYLSATIGQLLTSIIVISLTVVALMRVTKLIKRENEEARTWLLVLLAIFVGLMIVCQSYSIWLELYQYKKNWMLAISGYLYFTTQMSILVYCRSVSGRILDQSDDQAINEEEQE